MILFKRGILIFISILAVAFNNLTIQAQEDDEFKDVKIETVKVTDGIYMLKGEGGNIAVSVGDDGVFMVDDQFAPLTVACGPTSRAPHRDRRLAGSCAGRR